MSFKIPEYRHPDFEKLGLTDAPDAAFAFDYDTRRATLLLRDSTFSVTEIAET